MFLSIMNVNNGIIIPDASNAFFIYRSNLLVASGKTHTMYFNFQLPINSVGLGYKQIIAGQFTGVTSLGLDSGGNTDGTIPKFSCFLNDITNPASPLSISVTAIQSNTGDGSIFLCRIEDLLNVLTAGRNYGLRISLLTASFVKINQVIQISLFTTTTAISATERIILDSKRNFA